MKKSLLFFWVVLFCIFGGNSGSAQETITLTTYYPSPHGVYANLRMLTHGGTPSIDFSSDNAVAREFALILDGANDLSVQGGTTSFRNDDRSPALIRTGRIWICSPNFP